MSISYNLFLTTLESPEVLLTLLEKVPGYQVKDGQAHAPGLAQVMCRSVSPDTQEIINDELKFRPTLRTTFRCHGVEDAELTRQYLITGCMALLKTSPGDAALVFEMDRVLFVRRLDVLLLNSDGYEEIWTPQLLAVMTPPWKIQPLPHF